MKENGDFVKLPKKKLGTAQKTNKNDLKGKSQDENNAKKSDFKIEESTDKKSKSLENNGNNQQFKRKHFENKKDNKHNRKFDSSNKKMRTNENTNFSKENSNLDSNDIDSSKTNTKLKENGDNLSTELSDKERKSKDKSYKRSDLKYSKEHIERTRSNPKFEYNLEDADENERDIVLNGTINDRINCLALLCARNPNEKNFKQLLMFCENQRNDIIYKTLKLVRDLCKNVKIESLYIKNRIIKSFEMGAKNQYIKDKVVEIIGVLIRAEIFPEELINVLISRLIEKGETLNIVENALKSCFIEYKSFIFEGIEDFYFKNDSFRCQHNILKFIQGLEITQDLKFFKFLDTALSTLDEYPQEQKDQMVELLVNSLAKSFVEGETITNIEFLRSYVKTARSAMSVLSLLIKMSDSYTESYILKVSRTTLLRNTKYEPEFLNLIYTLENKDMFSKLVDNSFFYSVPTILSLMLIAHEKLVDTRYLFSLHIFMSHFNPLVRDVAKRLLNKEKIQKFDPFDKVYVEGQAKILGNK